ncbi:MAG TPA: hypothetical protein VFR47_19025 [Anaerolineales bacterium]|nr:hypothetical protein [Anaerolineales bacterium]
MSYPSSVQRSVYVLGDGLLFDEIIANMLTSEAGLRVIRSVYIDDAAFLTDVSLSRPDVILLSESHLYRCERFLALLSQISLPARLRVLLIKHDNNFIDIFDLPADRTYWGAGVTRTLKRIMGWNELLDLIGGRPFSLVGFDR